MNDVETRMQRLQILIKERNSHRHWLKHHEDEVRAYKRALEEAEAVIALDPPCAKCDGNGKKENPGPGYYIRPMTCPDCRGTGLRDTPAVLEYFWAIPRSGGALRKHAHLWGVEMEASPLQGREGPVLRHHSPCDLWWVRADLNPLTAYHDEDECKVCKAFSKAPPAPRIVVLKPDGEKEVLPPP